MNTNFYYDENGRMVEVLPESKIEDTNTDYTSINDFPNTTEVIIPDTTDVTRDYKEFIPLIISIITVINAISTARTGNKIIDVGDDDIYLIASGVIAIISVIVTSWKNTSFSKKDKQRKMIANQVLRKPNFKDIFK